MKLPLPTDILIQTAGAYLVGGSVRDMICGRRPMDYDIAVANDPQGYAENLAAKINGRVVTIGKPGFPLYRIVKAPIAVDVTPIKGPTIAADLSDRDFTINALACDLSNGKLIDTTGGLADVKQGVVRMVSARAFDNDPVRMVRAYRMAAHLDFDIEPATSRAIATQSQKIQSCAGERIWTELTLILADPDSINTLRQMAGDKLLFAIFPDFIPLRGCRQSEPHHLDVFEHTLLAYQSLEGLLAHPAKYLNGQAAALFQSLSKERQVLLKLAMLLHDIGKPGQSSTDASGKIHFYSHAKAGLSLARPIFDRLRLSKQQADWVEWTIANHSRPNDLFLLHQANRLTPKAIGKFLRQCGEALPYLILHALADNLGKKISDQKQRSSRLRFFNEVLDTYFRSVERQDAGPLVSGDDLMKAFDLEPSPLLGTLLKRIKEAQLVGTITHRQQALDWAKKFLIDRGLMPR